MRRLPIALAFAFLLTGCPEDDDAQTDGGRDAAAGGDASVDLRADGPESCLQIRNCIFRCMNDACREGCVNSAPAAARTLYNEVQACTMMHCPTPGPLYEECRCEEQCWADGKCFDVTGRCAGIELPDLLCDICV